MLDAAGIAHDGAVRFGVHRRRIWAEIAIVLGLSLGASAVYSIVAYANALTKPKPLASQTNSLNRSLDDREIFDLVYQLLRIVFDLMPVALVVFLLWSAARPHLSRLGLDGARPWRDTALGIALTLAIGIPGIALFVAGRALKLSLGVSTDELAGYWWTIPIFLLSATVAALTEEIIVVGYLFDRLRAVGIGRWGIIASTALLRGSYHLYQGVPQFIGNVAMGLLLGWLYDRNRRLLPFIVAHFVIDVAVFVGYPLVAGLVPSIF